MTITRTEYGEAWPFTVDSGVLRGRFTGHVLSNGTPIAEVTFTAQGKTYAVNGIARGSVHYADIDGIWAQDSALSIPGGEVMRINMEPIVTRGLALAAGRDRPYQPKASPPPTQGVGAPATSIRCDKFDIAASFQDALTGNRRTVRLSIATDLPDTTTIMLGISRYFVNAANGQEYTIEYCHHRSTVSECRTGRVVELDHAKWRAKLTERVGLLRRMGEAVDISRIHSFVVVGFTVPINQPDKRFAPRNANLTGAAVEVSGTLRVVRREAKLDWPVSAQ